MMGADYTDDLVFLVNKPTRAESLLHNLEQAARGIGIEVNGTEFMCFKQNDKPLNSVDHSTYFGSNISSTESDVNICTGKASNVINRVSPYGNLDSLMIYIYIYILA